MFKYVVLFDLAAWLLFYFTSAVFSLHSKSIRIAFQNCALACITFLIPFGITVFYYYRIGHLRDFWFYSFEVTGRIPVDRSFLHTLAYIADFHIRFLPVLFFFYYALAKGKSGITRNLISNRFTGVWCLMVLFAVLLPGKSYGHYFIQLMLPVSIIAGRFFSNSIAKPRWMNAITGYPVGSIVLAVLVVTLLVLGKRDYYDPPDVPRQVAAYLEPGLEPGDRIFTGNYQQVLYYLLGKDCPVKYVHRTLMCDKEHRHALNIDLPEEMHALMGMNFRYILMQGPYCYKPMNEYVRNNYLMLKEFPEGVKVYERK